MAARILAVRFSLCPHIPAKKKSCPSVVRCKMCSRHTIHLWTQIIMCKRHIILHSARFLSICPSISWMFLASTRWSFVVRPKSRKPKPRCAKEMKQCIQSFDGIGNDTGFCSQENEEVNLLPILHRSRYSMFV